jgi:hypothetical protein
VATTTPSTPRLAGARVDFATVSEMARDVVEPDVQRDRAETGLIQQQIIN